MIKPLKTRIKNYLLALAARKTGTITHVLTQDHVAALTFDGGPDPQWTPRLLEILERHRVGGTFFMIGEFAQAHKGIVQEVAKAGHVIGNHSWDHPSFPCISSGERRRQIIKCSQVLQPYEQRLFRPPYGHQSLSSRLDLLRCRYQVVTWNVVMWDWEGNHAADWMADQLERQVRPGCIILLHDAICDRRYMSREPVLDALNIFLKRVGNRFRFLTLPRLFQHGKIIQTNWYRKPDLEWLESLKA